MIFSPEVVVNTVSSTSTSINKLSGSIWCDEIDKFEDLCLMSEYVGCFGSGRNFGGKLLSLLNALLVLLISSAVLVVELDFDGVTDLLCINSFSLVLLSIFCLVNTKCYWFYLLLFLTYLVNLDYSHYRY